jgi:HEAT repeat protein
VNSMLEGAVALLAVVVVLLVALIIIIRIALLRRHREEGRLRPRAELRIAEYLTGCASLPEANGDGERGVLLAVALEALGDLRGSENGRLSELIERLGFVDEAISGLRARRRSTRRQAAATLSVIAPAAAADALIIGLGDRDAVVRTACARILADLGVAGATTAGIITVAKRDVIVVPGAVAAVVLALGTAQPSALASLLSGDAPPKVRSIAIEVAGQLRLTQHATLLRACLCDRDEVAAHAANGLGMIGDVMSVRALMDLAGDECRAPPARCAAIGALGSIGAASAVPLLESQLHADWPLMVAAARALSRLADPGLAALRRAAASSRPEIRAMAAAELGK